jgi:hypothetical protein
MFRRSPLDGVPGSTLGKILDGLEWDGKAQ